METTVPQSTYERIEQLAALAWDKTEEAESTRRQIASDVVSWLTESDLATKYAIAAGSWAALAAAFVALPAGDADEWQSRVVPCSDAVTRANTYKDLAMLAATQLSDKIQDMGEGDPSEPEEAGAWEAARVARREWRDASASMMALAVTANAARIQARPTV